MNWSARRLTLGLTLGSAVLLGVTAFGAVALTSDDDGPAQIAAAQTQAEAPEPPRLLPNMRSLEPDDLQIEVRPDGVRLLRFAGSLANVGTGPLLLDPGGDGDCPEGQRFAEQALHHDADGDDVFTRATDPIVERLPAGCMLDHPTHDHWHFDAMAAYTLRAPGAATPIVSRDKVSFCLRDNERAPGAHVTAPRAHFGDCARNRVQGISPGWVDVYRATLDGQTLRLPERLPAGPLCLEVSADPFDLMVETSETDNAAAVPIVIDGDSVERTTGTACG